MFYSLNMHLNIFRKLAFSVQQLNRKNRAQEQNKSPVNVPDIQIRDILNIEHAAADASLPLLQLVYSIKWFSIYLDYY